MDVRRQAAAGLLRERGIPDNAYQAFWNTLDIGYFLRHDPQDLAWHTEMLHAHADERRTSVHTRASGVGDGIEFLIFTMDKPALFARICRFFDQQRLSILEARVHTTRHGMALDSFEVMTTDQRRLPPEQLTRLEAELARLLDAPLDPGQLKPAGPSRLSDAIVQRIHEKMANYKRYNFSADHNDFLKAFFDLSQEYDQMEDFYRICVAVPLTVAAIPWSFPY